MIICGAFLYSFVFLAALGCLLEHCWHILVLFLAYVELCGRLWALFLAHLGHPGGDLEEIFAL